MSRGVVAGSQGAAAEPLGKLDWNFSQVFGERTPGEEVQDGKGPLLSQVACTVLFCENNHLCFV
jgi:hypothetical protein